jgi:hypothetical protein
LSIKALNYALDIKIGDPIAKLIFINLANHFNDATEYSYPSQELLAERAECSIRTVQRKIEMLIDLGLVKKIFRPNKTSLYGFPGLNGYDTSDVSDCHIQKMVTTNSGLVTTDGVVRTINNNRIYNNNKKNIKNVLLTELVLTDELKKYATDRELDAEEILEDIKLWNEQNGNKKKYASLDAFYMNWCRKEARRKPKTVAKVQSDQKDGKVAVRAEKGLTHKQLVFRDNIVARVEKLQHDPQWAYTNFDRLRSEIEEAMRKGSLDQYLNEKGLN